MTMTRQTVFCAICRHDLPLGEIRLLSNLPSAAREAILADHPDLTPDAPICLTDMARCRRSIRMCRTVCKAVCPLSPNRMPIGTATGPWARGRQMRWPALPGH